MAITVPHVATQNQNSGSTTITVTFGTLPSSGNDIIVVLSAFGATSVSSVVDNQTGSPNTYAVTPNASTMNSGASGAAIWRAHNITVNAGTFVITITVAGASIVLVANAIEVAGLLADDQATSSHTASTTTSKTMTAPGANFQADDLSVVVVTPDTGSASSAITDPATGGGTYTSIMVEQNGSTFVGAEASYRIETSIVTSTASWNYASAGDSAGVIATFKGLPSGPTINTQPANQYAHPGDSVTFSVSATASSGSLSYLWYKNGSSTGITTSSITLTPNYPADYGSLWLCAVTDSNGTVNTNSAAVLWLVQTVFGRPLPWLDAGKQDFRSEITLLRWF